RIPDLIVAADDDTIRRFLREYFSAEGSVLTGMRSVEISSASGWLMQQLSCMLRSLGIWLRITEKQKRATNGLGIYRTYHIGLIGGDSLRRFHDLVGFSDPVKQAKLATLCEKAPNTNVEGVPGSRPASKWTAATLTAYERLNPIDLEAIRDFLSERADREVFYARIVSVEDVDYTGWVYDFEVEEHHNFVAGGMLCHNTVQVLGLVASKREAAGADRAPAPTLLVCPMSLVGNWQREAERFTPDLTVHVHHGADRLAGEELTSALNAADLVITTYGLALR